MEALGIACFSVGGTLAFGVVAARLRKRFGSVSLRTERRRLEGFSVFDLQLMVGDRAERPRTEAGLYLTLKSFPEEPISNAKLLFDEKVRRLAE